MRTLFRRGTPKKSPEINSMSSKSKIILVSTAIFLVILVILLNYVSSEFFSLKYWNPIRKVYLKNILIRAEEVSSREKIETGLASRPALPEGRGMLFVMPSSDFQRFWMKGMQFPLDIIWIENGRVIGCEERIQPDDERIFTSPEKSSFVLEVNAGFCEKNNIQLNDAVEIK